MVVIFSICYVAYLLFFNQSDFKIGNVSFGLQYILFIAIFMVKYQIKIFSFFATIKITIDTI